ncbi:Rhodanese domain protein [Ignavibacterium album JCM 16511]|uniref:Rhodanese domain protein n=1 Tax=Ignavibacterium album (strain DSM 19864 / JCM 16511 / NBRC 101810 / Mat9-16) TaxID=945713 RepID=I0AKH3_IGNAJ|nr:rhodanese-like domain-containing protein [Ignavibacterium album]AFH49480.1 Rhodanese domain protein [Ignavibacterium album JCM 16511]
MDKKNLLSIITISISIGLIYNYLNPNGIPFIREERILEFASEEDSLSYRNDSISIVSIDSTNIKSSTETSVKTEVIVQKDSQSQPTEFTKPLAIKIDKAYQLYKQGVKFIDARMPDEYNEGHIKGAINIPFDGDESYRDILKTISKDELLVTYCSGTECDLSILLGDELFEKGYKRVYIFFGGWNDWVERGYPISKGWQ